MMAIWLALAAMLCAAANDAVFKLYRRHWRPVGAYFALIGLVMVAVFVALAPGAFWRAGEATLVWGLAAGLCSVVSNVLLVWAMGRHEVGVCATLYRLNLAPGALLAFWLLGEPMTGWKVAGVGCAVGAVLLFFAKTRADAHVSRAGLELVIVAALVRAGMGIVYKQGLSAGGEPFAMMAWIGVCWVAGGAAVHAMRDRGKRIEWHTGAYGALSGLLIAGIVYFTGAALEAGEASVVLPIAQLSFVATSLFGVIVLREAVSGRKALGLALAVLCVVCMAQA